MWSNGTKCRYMFMFPVKNLARKGLLTQSMLTILLVMEVVVRKQYYLLRLNQCHWQVYYTTGSNGPSRRIYTVPRYQIVTTVKLFIDIIPMLWNNYLCIYLCREILNMSAYSYTIYTFRVLVRHSTWTNSGQDFGYCIFMQSDQTAETPVFVLDCAYITGIALE